MMSSRTRAAALRRSLRRIDEAAERDRKALEQMPKAMAAKMTELLAEYRQKILNELQALEGPPGPNSTES